MIRTFKGLIAFSLILLFLGIACKIDLKVIELNHKGDLFAFSIRMTNIFLVKSGDTYLMIDAGYDGDAVKIEKKLDERGIDPNQIEYLLITHAHADHAGNAAYFKEKYGVKLIIGEADANRLTNGENGPICPTSLLARVFKLFAPESFPGVIADLLVKDSFDMVNLGFPIKIYQLGGHTPGSVYAEYQDILFVGDQIKGNFLAPGKVSRHYYMCDLESNNIDIQQLLAKHSTKYWLPGHFGVLKTSKVNEWLLKER